MPCDSDFGCYLELTTFRIVAAVAAEATVNPGQQADTRSGSHARHTQPRLMIPLFVHMIMCPCFHALELRVQVRVTHRPRTAHQVTAVGALTASRVRNTIIMHMGMHSPYSCQQGCVTGVCGCSPLHTCVRSTAA